MIQEPPLAVGPMDDAGSSLKFFTKAKEEINKISVKLEVYGRDTLTYIQNVQQYGSIVRSDDEVQVEGYIANVRDIRNVLTRDRLKVVFFGRTSNGKSSVMNAMLREKILPSGFGHTTSCFLQVEGSNSGESYLFTEGSTERQNVNSVEQLAHALCKEKLGESQLVRIYWPKDKCLLLRHDVVFVDSPGVDMGSNFDEWIDKHCLDADVFVFVANAESTLTLAEKSFFHKVSKRLAKPNIFILNNRWDVVASEPNILDEVRAQHVEQAVEFLVKELKVYTQKEANERIFFVSAKEALQAHLQEQGGLPAHSGALADGFQKRYSEFQDFERKFEECISMSAVKTKFEQQLQRGKHIVSEILHIIDSTYDQAQKLKTQNAVAKKEIHGKLKFTKQKLSLLRQEMEDKIQQLVEDVEERVSKALSEEIRRLSLLVDEFNFPFPSEERELNVYKKELNRHVEERLVSNLCARLSTALAMDIENNQREMTERMSGLLPAEKKQVLLNTLPRQEAFKISVNCGKLCADFHEDLTFRFSWNLLPPLPRRRANHHASTNNSQEEDRKRQSTWNTLGGLWSLGVAGLLVTTSVPVGAPVAATLYGGKYIYDRWKWTKEEQESEFKQQYVVHAAKKLRLIVDLTSTNCSLQVQRELSETLKRLHHLVDKAINDMDVEIKTLDKEIEQLEEAANSAEALRNRAIDITRELEIFDDTFLKLRNSLSRFPDYNVS